MLLCVSIYRFIRCVCVLLYKLIRDWNMSFISKVVSDLVPPESIIYNYGASLFLARIRIDGINNLCGTVISPTKSELEYELGSID